MFSYNNYDIQAGLSRVLPEHHVAFTYSGAFSDTWFIRHKKSKVTYDIRLDYKSLFRKTRTCKAAVKEVMKRFIKNYDSVEQVT